MNGKSPCFENPYKHGIMRCRCMVRKYSATGSAVRTVNAGTLIEVHDMKADHIFFCIIQTNISENELYLCKRGDVLFVPENLWEPLIAVEEDKRLPIVQDHELAEALGNITIGSAVKVLGSDNKDVCVGTITFKNYLSKLGLGVFFGLKIKYPNDGIHLMKEKISLLASEAKGFPRGCDIVASVDKLRPFNVEKGAEKLFRVEDQDFCTDEESDKNSVSQSKHVSNPHDKNQSSLNSSHRNPLDLGVSGSEAQKKQVYNIPLSVGEKVVLIHCNKPEKGTVKWLGFINNSLKVGVEFENPIGSGTGSLNGVELFRTKYLHAALLPPEALIKLSDFNVKHLKEFSNQPNPANNNNNNNVRVEDSPCCRRNHDSDGGKEVKINESEISEKSHLIYGPDYIYSSSDKCCVEGLECSCSCSTNCSVYVSEMEEYPTGGSDEKPNASQSNNSEPVNVKNSGPRQDKEPVPNWGVSLVPVGTPSSKEFIEFFSHDWKNVAWGVNNNAYDKDLNAGGVNVNTSESGNQRSSSQSNKKENTHSNDSQNRESQNPGPSTSARPTRYYAPRRPLLRCFLPEKLGYGSVVEFMHQGQPYYGVIKWIGSIPTGKDPRPRLVAGIEMEEEMTNYTDGTFLNRRYFNCNPNKALFMPLSECRRDTRFLEANMKPRAFLKKPANSFGDLNCPVVKGTVPPINQKFDVELICGKNRGIQGHHNSCYLDATLFSMFAFTCVFDSLLFRPPKFGDIPEYSEVQRVLKEEIVNPLRRNLYVASDRVMKLRTLLEELSSVTGLTSEEKDPEEFLYSLLAQILKAEPFLKLSSGQETFHYQLFVEKDENLLYPTVQQLIEQSFVAGDLKLSEIPSCLIIQMPRFGKSYKMYPRIYPPQILDITDILDNSPRQCTVCGKLAEYECRDCFGEGGIGSGLECTSFCKNCLITAHSHHFRMRHNHRPITVPFEFYDLQHHCTIPRIHMELFAVVCIETSHYVAFVKCGTGVEAPWCFFDSMADRKGEQNGYNIPEMVPCPDLPFWLSEEGAKALNEVKDERQLPHLAKRLLCDAYMCMYQSQEVMMYR